MYDVMSSGASVSDDESTVHILTVVLLGCVASRLVIG